MIDSRIFCLYMSVYVHYLKALFPNLPTQHESVLLYLLAGLGDLSGLAPALLPASDSARVQ